MSKLGKVIRTAISGLSGTAVDVIALIVLVEVGNCPIAWAAFAAAACGAVVAFSLSKFWAFRDPSPVRKRQVGAYALVALGTAIGVSFMVHYLAVIVGMLYLLAKAISSVTMFAVWGYPAQSRLVFAPAFASAGRPTQPFPGSRAP